MSLVCIMFFSTGIRAGIAIAQIQKISKCEKIRKRGETA